MQKNEFRWTREAEQVVRECYIKDGPKRLAERLRTTPASVTMKAKRLGVRPKQETQPYEWTEEMLTALRELYPTASKATLTERLGLPIYAIRDKARKLGLKNVMRTVFSGQSRSEQNTSCDIRFFDEWSQDMAYILGFLFADGSITKRQCDVVVALAISDRQILEWIKTTVKSRRVLTYREEHTDKSGYHHQRSVYLTLGSKVIVKRLMELGMMPRKTYRDDPLPNVPDQYLPNFVRGYFDGDGTAKKTGEGRAIVGFIGTPMFIHGIREVLHRLADMSLNRIVSAGDNCVRVVWGAIEDVRKFHDFIYPAGVSFCLERKRMVLSDWLNTNLTER